MALRVYREASSGRIVAQTARRVQGSASLIAAVKRNDAGAARRALKQAIKGEAVAVRLIKGSRTFIDIGSADALAPVHRPLKDSQGRTIASFVFSEQGDRGYAGTVLGFTGAQVLVQAGPRQLASTLPTAVGIPSNGETVYRGVHYKAYSFAANAFPSGSLRVWLLTPTPPASSCGDTTAQTVTNTLGGVAMRLYHREQTGGKAMAVVHQVEGSKAFRDAVVSGDVAATQRAIIGFFGSHIHVVRVRATRGTQLVTDLGGPFVLAPIAGALRDAQGRVVGHFLLAIQDDLGYVLLTHRFTGAQVLLREGSQQVMGTLKPGPASIPDRGSITYRGVRYQVFSFTGSAFPSGALRISLLVPSS